MPHMPKRGQRTSTNKARIPLKDKSDPKTVARKTIRKPRQIV